MALILATDDECGPEIFASVQGEGPSMGMPVAFMRLSRCNLACVWCDTAYTWHFQGDERPHRGGVEYDRKANQLSLPEDEVAARIMALGQSRLVITGGEPLLQAPALGRLLELLPDVSVEIETNGTTKAPARSISASTSSTSAPSSRIAAIPPNWRCCPNGSMPMPPIRAHGSNS